MKGCFFFFWRLIRRGGRLLGISLAAVVTGYWTGKHSVPGAFSGEDPAPAAPPELPQSRIPPKTLSLKHRIALLIQSEGVMSPRLLVELHSLSAVELNEVVKIAESWPRGTGNFLYDQAIIGLAIRDPEPAFAKLLKQRSNLGRNMRVSTFMAQWAKRDPHGALRKWEECLSEDEFGSNGLESIIAELGKIDLPLAFAKLRSLSEDHNQNHDRLGPHGATSMLCEALSSTAHLRDALIRELLKPENLDPNILWNGLPGIFGKMDFSEPGKLDQTMAWIQGEGITGAAKAAILSGVLESRMQKEDPPIVADWYMAEVGASQPAHRNYYRVVSTWSRKDLNGCGEWLNRQEPGPHLDNAINSFCMFAASKDMEAALAWSAKITNEPMRLNSLRLVWSRAKRFRSRQEMWQALENSPVSASDRQKLEAKLPPWD